MSYKALAKVVSMNTESEIVYIKHKRPTKIQFAEKLIYLFTRTLMKLKIISMTDRKYEIITE